MKKILWFLTVFIMFIYASLAAETIRETPSEVAAGNIFQVKVTMDFVYSGEKMAYEETLPEGFTFQSWEIEGTLETVDDILVSINGSTYSWTFTPEADSVVLTYWLLSSETTGNYTLQGKAIDADGETSDEGTSFVVVQNVCGDDYCDEGENQSSCPEDCEVIINQETQEEEILNGDGYDEEYGEDEYLGSDENLENEETVAEESAGNLARQAG